MKIVPSSSPMTDRSRLTLDHYEHFWDSSPLLWRMNAGPVQALPTDFFVAEYAPTARRPTWIYATCGMFDLELHLYCRDQATEDLVEILTTIAYFHLHNLRLGLGHTVNFGRSWVPGSICQYGLLSRPYLDGPNLEQTPLLNSHFLWLIPITLAERKFKVEFGLERLERLFESKHFAYANPMRSSVV